jgi:uncharacterized membrane protein YphA (DoxX/SURF4 family)
MQTAKTVVLWVATVLCAAMFLFAGGSKFLRPEDATEQFAKLGYPDWFRVLIAVLEITGAVLLLIPRVAWVGSGMLAVIMVGATYTLLKAGGYGNAIVPAVFFIVLVLITYARWPRSAGKIA